MARKRINLKELIDLKLSGELPDGQMMVDNDCWVYVGGEVTDDGAEIEVEVDFDEPALLEALTSWGIKWERV